MLEVFTIIEEIKLRRKKEERMEIVCEEKEALLDTKP